MVQSQFSLSWEGYKSSICSGFSELQQNGQFVDMTLAADGHFVKVHQVLMALVSPYLKDLITSAPCQHPVIFLNNVSYKTLCHLMEYVYTGEVQIPADNLVTFVDTAKALHIQGLENMMDPEKAVYNMVDNMPQFNDSKLCHISGVKSIVLPGGNNTAEPISLPAAARKISIKSLAKSSSGLNTMSIEPMSDDNINCSDGMNTSNALIDDSDADMDDDHHLDAGATNNNTDTGQSNLQFSTSIRGSLQIILNRYIYNHYSTMQRSGIRRWRCVDYRNHRCKAFVVTKGNVVVNRANFHNHTFHDKKILQKIEKNAVFSALDDVEEHRQKEDEVRKDTDNAAVDESEYKFKVSKEKYDT